MRMKFVGVMAVAAGLACLSACASAQEKDAPQVPVEVPQAEPGSLTDGNNSFDPNQPLRAGFQVNISVSSTAGFEPDLSGTFTLDGSAAINNKLAGLVVLKGLTASQAADKLAGALKAYLKEPKVAISILSVPKPVILLSGGINKGGATPVNDNTTLAELLTVVGFNDNADLSKVRVISRDEADVRTTKEFNFLKWLKPLPGDKPDDTQNPILKDRDFVHVPLKILPGTGVATVEGAVIRPGIVPIRVGVPTTLRELVSLSGGVNPGADRRQVSVRRVGVERPMVVDYDKMEAGDPLHNLVVNADDIVYVQTLGPDQYINLTGAFVRAGKLPYVKQMTLTQAISEVGGIVLAAKDHEGRIFRHPGGTADPTKTQIIGFNYRKVRQNQEPDILLEAGDTIEIQQGKPPGTEPSLLQAIQTAISLLFSFDLVFGGGRRR